MKRITLIIAVLLTITALCAQEHKTYSGNFLGGKATYSYYEKEEGRIFDGDFHWKIGQYEMSGKFKNDKRDGLWTYSNSFGDILKINYVDGMKDGLCEFKGNTISYSEVDYQVNFKDGRENGPIKYQTKGTIITGEYAQGFMTGVWERKFNDGSYAHAEFLDDNPIPFPNNNYIYNNQDGSKTQIEENDEVKDYIFGQKWNADIKEQVYGLMNKMETAWEALARLGYGYNSTFVRGLEFPKKKVDTRDLATIRDSVALSRKKLDTRDLATIRDSVALSRKKLNSSSQSKPNSLKGKFWKFMNTK